MLFASNDFAFILPLPFPSNQLVVFFLRFSHFSTWLTETLRIFRNNFTEMPKRYYSSFRKFLDDKMGTNRNGDKPNFAILDFRDNRLCKFDMAGLCPHKLFPNTRQDLGDCLYEVCPVPLPFKNQYEDAKTTGRESFPYEHDLEIKLEKLVRECDERVARGRTRLEQQATNEPEELKRLRLLIDKYKADIDALAADNRIEEAGNLMEEVERLEKEREVTETKLPSAKEQQLLVCEVCAALLSVNESDQRLADHFAGKGHLGFQRIRDKLKQLKEGRMQEYEKKRQLQYQSYTAATTQQPSPPPPPPASPPPPPAPSSSSSQHQDDGPDLTMGEPAVAAATVGGTEGAAAPPPPPPTQQLSQQTQQQQQVHDRHAMRSSDQFRREQEPRERERKHSSRYHHSSSSSSSSSRSHRHSRRDYSRSRSKSSERSSSRRRRERSRSN